MQRGEGVEKLNVLRRELAFLKNGGYKHPQRAKWRAQFIFEDSPTCLNFGAMQRVHPCTQCLLFAYVPEDARRRAIPCRHIPLNEKRETLDSLYRSATPDEIEMTVATWLNTEIERLEENLANEESKAAGAS